MKADTINTLISFVFKYVWILFILILGIETVATFSTAHMIVMRTTQDMMEATKNEVENKVDITWKLAEALSKDYNIANASIDMVERGRMLKPYAEVYNLFLVGLTDATGIIVSSYDDIPGYIGHKEYFQRVVTTGQPEITDVFVAGADGVTKNYTICMPIFDQSNTVTGTLIMSIYYDEINEIAMRALSDDSQRFSLLDSTNTIMSEQDGALIGKTFLEAEGKNILLGTTVEEVNEAILNKQSGFYWVLAKGTLQFIRYAPIENTNWSINIQTDVIQNLGSILGQYLLKVFFYVALFLFIFLFGKWYTRNKFKKVNALVKQITMLQFELQGKKVFEEDEMADFIEISQKGLFDSLTNLPTRSVFLRQQKMAFEVANGKQKFVLLSIDLDNLKQLNDKFGHHAGDLALQHIGKVILEMADINESFACRYGGDEFLVLRPYGEDEVIEVLLQSLSEKLHTTIQVDEVPVEIHSSIGVAFYPVHGTSLEQLYEHADDALYQAKKNGRNQYAIYTPPIEVGKS